MTEQHPSRPPAPGGASPGAVVEDDGRRSLRFTRLYPATPGDVWSAITDHDRMGKWAFAGHIEPRAGGSVHFGSEETEAPEGRVLTWDQPRVLEYRWGEGGDVWHVRFGLREADDGGTIVVFDHLFPDLDNSEFAAGWHWHLDRLGELLAGDLPAAVDEDQHFQELLQYYRL